MQTIEQKKISILEMAKGALGEEVSSKLGDIAANLMDPNTDHKKVRELSIKIKFTTNEAREIATVEAVTSIKLQPSKPVITQLAFGPDGNGELVAVELTRQVPGQQNVFGGEEPTAKLIDISARQAAQA